MARTKSGSAGSGKAGPSRDRFVREYLVDRNATQAAIRAGYSKRSAYSTGHALLKDPDVADAIRAGEQKLAERAETTADKVLAEIDALALGRIDDVLDFSGDLPRLKPAREMSENGRRLLAALKIRRSHKAEDDEVTVEEVMDFRLWDKLAALKLALQYRGLLVNRHEHVGLVELVHADDAGALEERAAQADPAP